jgi:Tfp pilus assembly protein PilP
LVPPIKRYPLEEFRLVGILWTGQQPKAMIVDPEKNTYVLGIGDEIGNSQGKIVEIRDNGILVEEKKQFEDIFGQKRIEIKKSILAFRE